jgi:hypothetical protein
MLVFSLPGMCSCFLLHHMDVSHQHSSSSASVDCLTVALLQATRLATASLRQTSSCTQPRCGSHPQLPAAASSLKMRPAEWRRPKRPACE